MGVMNSNERYSSSPPITGVRRTTSPRKAAAEALSAIHDQQVLDSRLFLENLTTPGSGSPSQLIVLQQSSWIVSRRLGRGWKRLTRVPCRHCTSNHPSRLAWLRRTSPAAYAVASRQPPS